jgi:ABC-type transporter Mla subunit MlaD
MLTRFVRIQLAIFTIVGIIGVVVMVVSYIQVPTLLGIGRMTITLELPAAGGLYRFSNVTYRGVQIGKVTAIALTAHGAKATLSLDTSPKIPADVKAEVRSISAVGEQYVDLRPRLCDRRERHYYSAADRSCPRSDQQVDQQHPQGQAQCVARRVFQGIQRRRLRFRIAVRFFSASLG